MAKQNERDYFKKAGKEGIEHAMNKPFSDPNCGLLLSDISAIMSLLPPAPKKILDLGCGMGWTSIFFAKQGYDVIGIDISEDAIKHANIRKKQEKIKNLKFLSGDYEDLNFNNEFDCVIFISSLHHAIDEKLAIKKAYESLKLGGICIISEPGKGHDKSEVAIQAVKTFGVTEKSMPPKKTMKIAAEIGFRKIRIFPRADETNAILYKRNPSPDYANSLRSYGGRIMVLLYEWIFHKKDKGVVLLVK